MNSYVKKKIFIIIVNYSQAELTIKCVNSIKKSFLVNPVIVVVDNDSPNNDLIILKDELDEDVVLLEATSNNGFAAGTNIGIKYALDNNADYIMLLNNDTEIDPYMISKLCNYVNDQTAVSPKMYYYDNPNIIWFAGGEYKKRTGGFYHIGCDDIDCDKYSSIIQCGFLTGCCIMLSGDSIRKTGLLDEKYFMYMEDVDYSLRLINNGISLLMIPEAKLWHKVGSSSGGERSILSIYYGSRNRLYLQKKFNFNFYVRARSIINRLFFMIKGFILNTNEKIIFRSIIDFLLGNMYKTL